MVRAVIRVPYTEDGAANGIPGAASFDGSSAGRLTRIMSKVPSLMFDMEDTEEAAVAAAAAAAAAGREGPPEGDVAQELSSLLEPWGDQEYMLLLHMRIASEDAAKRGRPHLEVRELADTLRRLGYTVKLRTALGGGWGGSCLRNLRHSFLVVTLPGAEGGAAAAGAPQEIIVESRFREQFEIAHATPRYERILAAVPAEAAAPQDRLHRTVELLCAEMARAFCETGTPLPPWRQTAAMLSKWCPRRSEEIDISRDGGAPQAAAAAAVAAHATGVGGAAATTPGKAGSPLRRQSSGGNTVAAKLAMLGVEPAPASPISEGLEDLDAWSSSTDEAGLVNMASSGSSPSDAAPVMDEVDLERRQGGATATAAEAAARMRHRVWVGIRSAVEAMPNRRNTWA